VIGGPARQRRLLLQAALLPDAGALRAWRHAAPNLDLDAPSAQGFEVLALLSWRLTELGLDPPAIGRCAGMRRRNWVANEFGLAELAARLGSLGTPSEVVTGRAATVLAYLPAPGLLPIGEPEVVDDYAGHTMMVSVRGSTVAVPAPAEHLVAMLARGQWLDAALAAGHAETDWPAVGVLAATSESRARVYRALRVLADLTQRVPGEALAACRPGPRERLRWAAGDLVAAGARVRHRARVARTA
jgi:hypothetical protein